MKFCVIGLGRFGEQVAITLAENGMEVLAIDSNETIVASIRDSVTQAVCMRVSDEASLRSIGVDEMDVGIVAVGENFAQSILVTALLKKRLNIPTVIARGTNDMHKEILKLIGADRVILPERAIAIRLADNLSSPFAELTRLTKNYSVSQIRAPKLFVGKTVSSLNMYEEYGVYCIGMKVSDEKIVPIDPDHTIEEDDKLIFSGLNADLERVAQL
jgi:trk system potassium uptake protein TrkA